MQRTTRKKVRGSQTKTKKQRKNALISNELKNRKRKNRKTSETKHFQSSNRKFENIDNANFRYIN